MHDENVEESLPLLRRKVLSVNAGTFMFATRLSRSADEFYSTNKSTTSTSLENRYTDDEHLTARICCGKGLVEGQADLITTTYCHMILLFSPVDSKANMLIFVHRSHEQF